MRTQQEAEAWAQQHGAVLKVNFAEGMASLQIGGFVASSRKATPLDRTLPELVEDLERQLGERLTQPDSIPGDLPGRSR